MPLTADQLSQLEADVKSANADLDNASLRATYYHDVAQFGDPYGELAAGVATNSTLLGAVANTFLESMAASQYGVNLTPEQMSNISNQLMNADLQARRDARESDSLTPREIADYHDQVFSDNGLGAGVWTETLPFEISPSTLTTIETGGVAGAMEVFGMMLAGAFSEPGDVPTPWQTAAQVWVSAVMTGFTKHLGSEGVTAGSAFIHEISAFLGLGEQDPLVMDLTGNGLNLEARSLATPYFDFAGIGMAENTAWIGAGNGFLATTETDGLVHNGTDLIDTFAQLRGLDSNHDGIVNSADAIFNKLVVWQDLNGDGVSQANEISTLAQLGIASIALSAITANTVVNGSTILQTATIGMANGTTREIAQVGLDASPTYTRYVGPDPISAAAVLLPQVQGYGTLRDLRHAMSADTQLLTDVQTLLTIDPANAGAFDGAVQTILYRWAGVDGLAANSRGGVFDGQKLGFLEAITGQRYVDSHGSSNPENVINQGVPLDQSWNAAFAGIKARAHVPRRGMGGACCRQWRRSTVPHARHPNGHFRLSTLRVGM